MENPEREINNLSDLNSEEMTELLDNLGDAETAAIEKYAKQFAADRRLHPELESLIEKVREVNLEVCTALDAAIRYEIYSVVKFLLED